MHKVFQKDISSSSVKMFHLRKLRTLSHLHKMQLQQTSLYEVLGVREDATHREIKSAYFALSKKFHPDFNLDIDTKVEFMQVQNAYKVLSCPLLRSSYDNASSSLSKRYILWKRLEDREQSSNESLKSALQSSVSPLRARQEMSTELGKLKELDIPSREQRGK